MREILFEIWAKISARAIARYLGSKIEFRSCAKNRAIIALLIARQFANSRQNCNEQRAPRQKRDVASCERPLTAPSSSRSRVSRRRISHLRCADPRLMRGHDVDDARCLLMGDGLGHRAHICACVLLCASVCDNNLRAQLREIWAKKTANSQQNLGALRAQVCLRPSCLSLATAGEMEHGPFFALVFLTRPLF